eukprot:764529_1
MRNSNQNSGFWPLFLLFFAVLSVYTNLGVKLSEMKIHIGRISSTDSIDITDPIHETESDDSVHESEPRSPKLIRPKFDEDPFKLQLLGHGYSREFGQNAHLRIPRVVGEVVANFVEKNTFLIDQICAKKPDDNDGIGVVVGKLPCVFGDYAVVKRCTSGNVRNGELDWKVEVIDKRQPKWFSLGKLIETTDDRVLRLCGVFDYVHINNTPICGAKRRSKPSEPKELRVLSQVACTNGASVKIGGCSDGEQSRKYKICFILPDGTTTEKDGFTDMFVSTFEENNKIFEEICRDAALMNTK